MPTNSLVFKNVKTVTVAGNSISNPISVTLEYDDAYIQDATNGASFPTKTGTGARVRRLTVEARDPVTLFAALGDYGSNSFILIKITNSAEASPADVTFSLGSGACVSFSGGVDVGEPGSFSVSVILVGAS